MNMANLGDLFQEFHNAKPSEKAFIIIAVLAVGGAAFYLYKRGSLSTVSSNSNTQSSGNGNSSAFPTVQSGNGSYPLLPYGVTPIYDSQGNLVGYQNPPTQQNNNGGSSGGTNKPPIPDKDFHNHHKELTYTVKSGDTLTKIGSHYGLSWEQVYQQNKKTIGSNPNVIKPGEKLIIPTGGNKGSGPQRGFKSRSIGNVKLQSTQLAQTYSIRGM